MPTVHTETSPDPLSELMSFDLNLLLAFDVLVRERSVTRAAARLGVTQSAMSHTLRRLRDALDDPLLVRAGGGMVLTPRAEALESPLRAALLMLGRALAGSGGFEPATSRRRFRVSSPDLFDALALPDLLEIVGRTAPQIDLVFRPFAGPNMTDELETGELDLALIAELDEDPEERPPAAGLVRRTVLRDTFSTFLRLEHPLLQRTKLTLDDFCAAHHALVSPSAEGLGIVDHALAALGRGRRVALRVSHFYTGAAVIARSDLILSAPTALHKLASHLPLVTIPPPLPLPAHSLSLLWHSRFSEDPGHRWLRQTIAETCARALSTAAPPRGRGRGRRST